MIETLRYVPSRRVEDLQAIAELYTGSFPASERRPMHAFAEVLSRPECCFYRLVQGVDTVGMLHLWELEGFCFCEHFAVAPERRGQGLGEEAMRFALNRFGKVVLEVEPPVDTLSSRRIAFYERMGFSVVEQAYQQPQYDATLPPVGLYLMASQADDGVLPPVPEMVEQIYTVVYKTPVGE